MTGGIFYQTSELKVLPNGKSFLANKSSDPAEAGVARLTKGRLLLFLLSLGFLAPSNFTFHQSATLVGQLNTYDFSELDSLQSIHPRNAVIFLRTDWCRYCKRMEHSTFKNSEVQMLLNESTYFMPFDAESNAEINFAGQTLYYLPQGRNTGVHELALLLGKDEAGKISYPSLIVLSPERKILWRYQGYLSAKQLVPILRAAIDK